LIVGPSGCGKRFTADRLSELLVRENSLSSEFDLFKISFEQNSAENVERLLDDFEIKVSAAARAAVGKKSMVAVLQDSDDSASFSRFFIIAIKVFKNYYDLFKVF
jgi:ABC-type dipeptide/oligopeptide/nickel transport system ATPase component